MIYLCQNEELEVGNVAHVQRETPRTDHIVRKQSEIYNVD